MSYILDALKRADAERERGAIPGLHTRQMTNPALVASPSAGQRAGLVAVAVLALGGVATGVWFWQQPASPVQRVALAPAVAQLLPSAPPVVPPAPAPVVALTPVVVVPKVAAAPKAAPVVPRQAAPKPPPPSVPVVNAPPPKSRPKQEAAVVVAAAVRPSADSVQRADSAAIPLLSELPDNIRRQLPPLVISGSVYSSNPGQRLLVVNNQVLPQGSQAAPEVKLEEIRAKSAVFSFRGQRFEVAN